MRIEGWRIDGFGVFSGARVAELPTGLTIVSGPNEAGKSTLLAYLRGVLFGFPDGRSRARRHDPVNGGRHGGSVTLADPDGELWVVERHLDPRTFSLRGPDGALVEDHRLGDLLGHADAGLFANVFAFGLGELDSFEILDSDEVRDRVFAAGVVGGGRSAREAVDALDARRAALLRPRGRCDIRELADATRTAQRTLASARASARELVRRREEVDALEAAAHDAHAAVDAGRAEARRAATLLDAWPSHRRAGELDERIAALVVPEPVDEDVVARLTAVRADLAAAESSHADAVRERARAEERLAEVALDDEVMAIAADARDVVDELGVESSRCTRLADLDQVVEARRSELEDHLRRLGPQWDRAHLVGFDVSIPAADEVRRRGEVTTDLEEVLDDAEAARDGLQRALTDIESELELVADVESRPVDVDDVERRTQALRQLRADLVDLGSATAQADAAQGTVAGLTALSSRGSARTSSIGILFTVVGLVLSLAGGAAIISDAGPIGAGLAITGGSALVLGIVVLLSSRSAAGPEVVASLRSELREARRTRDEVQARIERLRTRVQASALVLGLPQEPTAEDVEACAADLDSVTSGLRERRDAGERRTVLEVQAARLRAEVVDADEVVSEAAAALADDRSAWDEWKLERRIPVALGVAAVNDLFTAIERSRGVLRELESAEAERTRLDEGSSQWRAVASDLCARAGVAESGDLLADVRTLSDRVAADAEARRTATERAAVLDDARERVEVATAALDAATAARAEVWTVLEVDSDREADVVVARWRERRALAADADAARAAVGAALGSGADAEDLLAELSTGAVEAWTDARAAADDRLPTLEAAHEAAIRAHHDAERDLEQLSRSADVADAALHLEALRTRLADAVEEWRTLTAARTIVADTLARYERERQPAVLARAEQWFAQITDGHYQTVTVAEGEIVLIDRAGRRLTTDDLSRGTAEQLYLCLRFGLAAEMVVHSPLPFVMDDVLVNFDPERTARMAEVIASIAEEHQVLLFTCQPSTVDALKVAAPDAHVIELPRHGGHEGPPAN